MEDKKKSKNISSSKKLSILISRDGLSFCVSEEKDANVSYFLEKRFEGLETPDQILKHLKDVLTHQLSEKLEEIAEIAVLYQNTLYSFVPDAYFSEEKLTDYLKFNIKILPTDVAAYDLIPHAAIKNVYLPYMNINNFLFENFGEFTYRHTTSVFTEKALESAHTPEEKMHLNVQANQLDVCIVKDSTLLLCNSFEFETPTDFVYYVLFCLEQLKLDPEKIEIILSGKIDEKSPVYELLYTYIRTIKFEQGAKQPAILPENLQQEAFYKNHILLSSLSCA